MIRGLGSVRTVVIRYGVDLAVSSVSRWGMFAGVSICPPVLKLLYVFPFIVISHIQ